MAEKGLIIVYTGNGKGKTTAALGLAVRAMGHNLRVGVIQFIKGSWKYGELISAGRFKGLLDFHVMGKGFTWKSANIEEDRRVAREAWAFAGEIIRAGGHDMVILDELTYLIKLHMVDERDILDCLLHKPERLHVVITGRDASQGLIETADLVTEMRELKHPLKAGVKAQKGIEF